MDGLVTNSDGAVCPRGAYGAGGLYDPATQGCALGVVMAKGMALCPGANGHGTIYPPSLYVCQNGILLSRPGHPREQARITPRPPQPPIALPLGTQKLCAAGQKGPGGSYVPGFASCDQGLIH